MNKNHNLRNNNFVSKNKTIQKRTIIGGFPSTITVTIPVGVYVVARVFRLLFIPVGVTILLMGFHMDDPNIASNAANVASQLVDNTEAIEDLTATAEPNNTANAANEASQLVDNAEAMPGLTATAGTTFMNQVRVDDNIITGTGLGVVGTAAELFRPAGSNNDNQESEAFINSRQLVIEELRNTVRVVDSIRHRNMALLRQANQVLNVRAHALEGHLDFVRDNLGDLYRDYSNIWIRLQNISTRAGNTHANYRNNNILTTAQRSGVDPGTIFHDIQDPLDLLSGDIEILMRKIDPNCELDNETDSDTVSEAYRQL